MIFLSTLLVQHVFMPYILTSIWCCIYIVTHSWVDVSLIFFFSHSFLKCKFWKIFKIRWILCSRDNLNRSIKSRFYYANVSNTIVTLFLVNSILIWLLILVVYTYQLIPFMLSRGTVHYKPAQIHQYRQRGCTIFFCKIQQKIQYKYLF